MVRDIEKLKVTLVTFVAIILNSIYDATFVVEYSPYGAAHDATEALFDRCVKSQPSDLKHVQ